MFLIFDTETTGLPRDYNAALTDLDNWPRMVQIAWQLHDKTGKLLNNDSIIIKPENYTIPFNAIQIHGITNERALTEGKQLKLVLEQFILMIDKCTYLCGHNIGFDINIIGAELLRCGLPNVFNEKLIIDTKNDATTNFCALPGGRGGKYKWPTLTELYSKLFNAPFDEAHNAAFDVQATSRVFFEIIKRGITKVKEISSEDLTILKYQDVDLSELLDREKKLKNISPSNALIENIIPIHSNQSESPVNIANINFSHLHNHSQFSVLQSTSDVKDMVKKAVDYNLKALAITDHGNMYGAFIFWQSIDKVNKLIRAENEEILKNKKEEKIKDELKCIIGCELNICLNHQDKKKQDNGYTQVLLSKNRKGYQNLSKLSSIGLIDGAYYVPRIDKQLLEQYKEGLIATTGGLNSEIPYLILNVGEEKAEAAFVWYKDLF